MGACHLGSTRFGRVRDGRGQRRHDAAARLLPAAIAVTPERASAGTGMDPVPQEATSPRLIAIEYDTLSPGPRRLRKPLPLQEPQFPFQDNVRNILGHTCTLLDIPR